MGAFGPLDETILRTWFDELMFGIGVTSLWQYIYYVQGTGRSAADQIRVTHILHSYVARETCESSGISEAI
jgi:hypothetical protein